MDIRIAIVELISKNDGQWSWYQLDRGLAIKGFSCGHNLLLAIKSLVEDKLLEENSGHNIAQPLYSVTEKGVAWMNMTISDDRRLNKSSFRNHTI